MKAFAHASATSIRQASQLLQGESAQPIAGGTDLIPLLQERIATPDRLVNLKTIPGLDYVRHEAGDSLRLGALARLAAVAANPLLRERFALIPQALAVAASPQLRNAATVAGNLCQRPRCWYFRGPYICLRRGGQTCFAVGGENKYHAILGGFRCHIVHPSDLAPALIALGAQVRLAAAGGERTLAFADCFVGPQTNLLAENVLRPDELIVEVRVPEPPAGARGIYLKAMERQVWAFALASVAAQVEWGDGARVREVHLVLGGVAPVPWRARGAEDVVRGQAITGEVAAAAGRAAVAEAQPMEDNAYKTQLTANLVRRALLLLAAEQEAR